MSVLDDVRRAKAARDAQKGFVDPERYEQYEQYEQIPPTTTRETAVLLPSNPGQLCNTKSEHPRDDDAGPGLVVHRPGPAAGVAAGPATPGEPGSASDRPMIDIPASGWRWAVTAGLAEGATAAGIATVEESVYCGMIAPAPTTGQGPRAGRFDPKEFHDKLFRRRIALWTTSDGLIEWHDTDKSLSAVDRATILRHQTELARWLATPTREGPRKT
jgi:hypothetical protein